MPPAESDIEPGCDTSEPMRTYDDAIVLCEKSQESRLGLARIRAEAEMQLAYSIAGDENYYRHRMVKGLLMLQDHCLALSRHGLATSSKLERDVIYIVLAGTCDMEGLPHLKPFLDELHLEVVRNGAKQVVFDCENLFLMNSTCIKCFITWIGMVRALDATQRYTVAFQTNKRLAWQERTLGAIQRFAPEIVSLEG